MGCVLICQKKSQIRLDMWQKKCIMHCSSVTEVVKVASVSVKT